LSQNSQNENLAKNHVDSVTRRQLREFVNALRPFCVSIEQTAEGAYVIGPRREVVEDPAALTKMYAQVTERGGTWMPATRTFTLPANSRLLTDPAQKAHDLLKAVFSHSENEISILVVAGLSVENVPNGGSLIPSNIFLCFFSPADFFTLFEMFSRTSLPSFKPVFGFNLFVIKL
jgi:hypothetical protein